MIVNIVLGIFAFLSMGMVTFALKHDKMMQGALGVILLVFSLMIVGIKMGHITGERFASKQCQIDECPYELIEKDSTIYELHKRD